MKKTFDSATLRGITVATILPFREDMSIDWNGYERTLRHCATADVASCVFVNGHAGEATALSDQEKAEVLRVTREFVTDGRPLMAGVVPMGLPQALSQIEAALKGGADVVTIFPPEAIAGGNAATRAPVLFFEEIAKAFPEVPLSVFQFPVASGFGYSTGVLADIAQIDTVVAVKEGSGTILAYEENVRAVKKVAPEVQILASNFNWFFAQLAFGADGILSGMASVTPHLLNALWQASEEGDLGKMRAVADRLYPMVKAIYHPAPVVDMHTRIKEGLVELGVIERSMPRAPLLPLNAERVAEVRQAFAGLTAAEA
ncbi:dihydrodipicolinate synthase family protein [Sinirhodobacter populi]|uniref:Dihydrodipicolinate synthase family protein n=1 Tax=Paenirhodobacter populi TaxID=2306993 RepID=A0A443K348_9RHOB|nr:dihydrodipicolinate synthase family protein [Sinirhodobacter populi]RWR27177.1 dihydrodipicolinate synthase family protein [Sinirhodobacter populi]